MHLLNNKVFVIFKIFQVVIGRCDKTGESLKHMVGDLCYWDSFTLSRLFFKMKSVRNDVVFVMTAVFVPRIWVEKEC